MKDEELYYKRVYIRTEEDLPKEGKYLVKLKDSDRDPYYWEFEEGSPANKAYWLKRINWYLQLIKESSLREDLHKAWLAGIEYEVDWKYDSITGKLTGGDKPNFDKWIDEYLKDRPAPDEVTDEEIEKESEKVIINYLTHNNPEGDYKESTIGADDKRIWWVIGAKAMRDGLIKKGDK
jgi:hypothetical protein